jgi:hypothetical protein
MQGEGSEQNRKRLGRVAFWLGAGMLVIAVMQSVRVTDTDSTDSGDQADDSSALRSIRVKTVDIPPSDPSWRKGENGDFELIAGKAQSISAANLPVGRPLTLNLILPADRPAGGGLRAQIISMVGDRRLKLPDAHVTADGDRARVEIESGWLSPGRYRIEIEDAGQSTPRRKRYLIKIL